MELRKKSIKEFCLFIIVFFNLIAVFGNAIESSNNNEKISYCYFIPPKDWALTDPKQLGKSVIISFFKKKESFSPSINLATEQFLLSENEYLAAVKKIHQRDRHNSWRYLGKIKTKAGIGHLTEINSKLETGSIRLLQMVFFKKPKVFILTAAALQEDFENYNNQFRKAFESLNFTENLVDEIAEVKLKESLNKKKETLFCEWQEFSKEHDHSKASFLKPRFQKRSWLPFQKFILKNFKELGSYWQILFLQLIQEELLSK